MKKKFIAVIIGLTMILGSSAGIIAHAESLNSNEEKYNIKSKTRKY